MASLLGSVAEQVLPTTAQQHFWIAQIGIESGYLGTARSKTGAVGLGQLIPGYRKDFGSDCDLTEVEPQDLSDDYTNAYLSACYMRQLIAMNDGNLDWAAVSYSAGPWSQDGKAARVGKQVSKVSKDYVRHINVANRKATP